MIIKNSKENRRHFLKKLMGGLAATTALPWITGSGESAEAADNFLNIVENYTGPKNDKDER